MRFHRRNLNSLFGRVLALAGLLAVAAFTFLGSWEGNAQNWLLLAMVWASDIGALLHFLRSPVITTTVEDDGTLDLVLQSGFSSRRLRCPPGSVAPPVVRTSQGPKQGPFHQCLISVAGEEIAVVGTYNLERAEQARDELAAALERRAGFARQE